MGGFDVSISQVRTKVRVSKIGISTYFLYPWKRLTDEWRSKLEPSSDVSHTCENTATSRLNAID